MVDPLAHGPRLADVDYSSFVGLVRERNRPSGGVRTVQEAATQARITVGARVLEIGSNTGFTAVNLALLTGASVTGVDLNQESITEAAEYARQHAVSDRVRFLRGDARSLAVADGAFDAVWVSNVTSFVADKQAMLDEVCRALVVGGTLIAVPIYYRSDPPRDVVKAVSRAIGTQIDVMTKAAWRTFFESRGDLEIYYESDFAYDRRGDSDIQDYCETLMAKPHLQALDENARVDICSRMLYFMRLFNVNLQYAGFSILLYQKRMMRDEIELFSSYPVPTQRSQGLPHD